ncbi:MAG: extracellular matrix regulator RemB [bacterium]
MFIHIGGNTIVRTKDIISINDFVSTKSAATKEFLEIAREEGFVEDISNGSGKSFIIVIHNNQQKVYISPISSSTLGKRAGFIDSLANE